jgi:uncharacterized protein (DUF2147 family)
MSFRRVLPALIAVFAVVAPATAKAAGPEGMWQVEDKTGHIKIMKCGAQMWGMIAWQKTPKNDENNPNAAMHSKPLVGSAILIGMKPAGDRYEGDIYNPRDGRVYSSKMALLPSGKLQIKGCVLGGLICGGEDWTRLPEDPAAASKITCASARSPVSR